MSEAAFLRAVQAHPRDDAALLVYADWLDERDEPAKAEYLRLTARPPGTPGAVRLRDLAAALDPGWLAAVARLRVENCPRTRREQEAARGRPTRLRFTLVCDLRWEDLAATADPAVRSCGACQQDVYYCEGVAEARRHATRGRCVAVSLAAARAEGDLEEPLLMLGKIAASPRPGPAE